MLGIRARGVALPLMVVAAVAIGLLVPAEAGARYKAPSVSLRQTTVDTVRVTGRTAKAKPRVRFHKRTRSGWAFVKRVRARNHRYATTLRVAPGRTVTFRVTSNKRSRKFVVRMPARSTVTPPPTLYDDCGARPRKADGTAWSCTFNDEFNGTTLDRGKWVPQTAFATGSADGFACYLDDPSTVGVGGGSLNLTVRRASAPVSCNTAEGIAATDYVSGMVSTYHLFSQQYGRFEARIKNAATTSPGLHEAFWLWPDDRVPSTVAWPEAGEIDISETYSNYSDLSIPFLHYSADAGGPQPGVNTAWNCTAHRGQWNTYTLEWSASRLSIFVNGKLCLTNTSGDPAFKKPYIVALTQALGSGTNVMSSSTPIPATMNVDYLRVWS